MIFELNSEDTKLYSRSELIIKECTSGLSYYIPWIDKIIHCRSFNSELSKINKTAQEWYDRWVLLITDNKDRPKCPNCDKELKWFKVPYGYRNSCSVSCARSIQANTGNHHFKTNNPINDPNHPWRNLDTHSSKGPNNVFKTNNPVHNPELESKRMNSLKPFFESGGAAARQIESGTHKSSRGIKSKHTSINNIIINCDSTYEARTCLVLDKWIQLGLIKNYSKSKDYFIYNGCHRYYPDFRIVNNDESIYYLETKGAEYPVDLIKYESIRNLGIRLDVWYLADIINEELKFNLG